MHQEDLRGNQEQEVSGRLLIAFWEKFGRHRVYVYQNSGICFESSTNVFHVRGI